MSDLKSLTHVKAICQADRSGATRRTDQTHQNQ
jgi:hypothetical protein